MNFENLIIYVVMALTALLMISAVTREAFDRPIFVRSLYGILWAVLLALAFGAYGKPFGYQIICTLVGAVAGFILGVTRWINRFIRWLWGIIFHAATWWIRLIVVVVTILLVGYVVLVYIM